MLWWLLACTPDPGTTTEDVPTDPTETPNPTTPTESGCAASIVSITPENGATEVSRDAIIEVVFTESAGDQPWSLDVFGVAGSAALDEDGLSATFVPDAPLPPDTTVQVQAEICGDARLSAFTTTYGIEPSNLEGRTYAVNYGTVVFQTPDVANQFQPADWILVQFDTVTGDTATAVAGLGNGSTPEPDCSNTLDAGTADLSGNPGMTVGPTDFVLPWGTDLVTIEDFTLDGRFGVGAGTIEDVAITGWLDTRGVTTIPGVCNLSALTGVPCEPCRDGAPRCLPVSATASQADYWSTVDVTGICGL